jgi:hypothetical protein
MEDASFKPTDISISQTNRFILLFRDLQPSPDSSSLEQGAAFISDWPWLKCSVWRLVVRLASWATSASVALRRSKSSSRQR